MGSRTVGRQRLTHRTDALRRDWDALAAGYDRLVTPFTSELAEDLVAGLGLRPGLRVLDVACGTGALAIAVARGGAQVVAVDLAGEMIERLGVRARDRGLPIDGRVMDGRVLAFDDRTFDAVLSLHGVSTFPDVAAGLRELARVTRPGGRVVVAGFGAPQRTELRAFFLGALQVAVPGLPWRAMDPPLAAFQVAEPSALRRRILGAGLTDVQVGSVTWRMGFESASHFWDVVAHTDPLTARLVGQLTARHTADAQRILEGMFRERSGGDPGVVLSDAVHVAVGTVPEQPGVRNANGSEGATGTVPVA